MALCDITIDISFLGSHSGIGTYSDGLLTSLAEVDHDQAYNLVSNSLPQHISEYAGQQQIRTTRLNQLPSSWPVQTFHYRPRLVWQCCGLPKVLKAIQPAVFHSLDGITLSPFSQNVKQIITVHDIIPLTHPQFCRYRDAFLARRMMPFALKKADQIIAVSKFTADCIIEQFPQFRTKIEVIYSGIDMDLFKPGTDDHQLAEQLAESYRLYSSRFWLSVVTLSPRRNLNRLLQAFAGLIDAGKDHNSCLVIAGSTGWKSDTFYRTLHDLKLEHRVHIIQGLVDEQLVQFYRSAFAFIHPSLLEGFGFPVLEAMACGTPVACSGSNSLGEITQSAALHFDPLDVQSIQQSMVQLVEDHHIRDDLIEKGLSHVQAFKWESTAQQVVDVYRKYL